MCFSLEPSLLAHKIETALAIDLHDVFLPQALFGIILSNFVIGVPILFTSSEAYNEAANLKARKLHICACLLTS